KVAASSDLYLALSDMDAQTANILLVGDTDQAEEAERIYDRRRGEAGAALVQAAQLAAGSGAEERNVREVIDGLGAYERLVTEARAAGTGDGEPSDEAVARYREATDLMRLELLPKAYNLTLDSGATVRATYEEKRAAVLAGAGWTAAAGLVAVAALGWHHRNLATRFRRRINPAVAAAAAGALLLAGTAAGTLLLQAERMREAKEDGLDSVLALSRAHAISTGMHGDQSRFLLDTGQADTYEQVYLDGARSVVFVEGEDLAAYTAQLEESVGAYPDAELLGLLGLEAAEPSQDGGRERAADVLDAYLAFQQADAELREIARDGSHAEAVEFRMGEAEEAYAAYESALADLTRMHADAYDGAVAAGDRGLRGWGWILPAAVLAVAALAVAGAYPRLAEYR